MTGKNIDAALCVLIGSRPGPRVRVAEAEPKSTPVHAGKPQIQLLRQGKELHEALDPL
ncbi:MAG: hypothetical protein KGH60_01920 [Candidatus Micrarchaeota archaeon]|nr:hypothetical protein [Candidatus Micrarchaeota archaeon]